MFFKVMELSSCRELSGASGKELKMLAWDFVCLTVWLLTARSESSGEFMFLNMHEKVSKKKVIIVISTRYRRKGIYHYRSNV